MKSVGMCRKYNDDVKQVSFCTGICCFQSGGTQYCNVKFKLWCVGLSVAVPSWRMSVKLLSQTMAKQDGKIEPGSAILIPDEDFAAGGWIQSTSECIIEEAFHSAKSEIWIKDPVNQRGQESGNDRSKKPTVITYSTAFTLPFPIGNVLKGRVGTLEMVSAGTVLTTQ